MSENVVYLHSGAEILAPGEVSAATVSELEKLLEAAKSGEIQGIVVFMAHSDGTVSYTDSDLPPTYKIVGKMLQVMNYMAERAGAR